MTYLLAGAIVARHAVFAGVDAPRAAAVDFCLLVLLCGRQSRIGTLMREQTDNYVVLQCVA